MTQTKETGATRYLTYAFLALIVWLPLPLGSGREWAVSLMEIWVCLLAVAAIWLIVGGRLQIPPALRTGRWMLLLFSLHLLWLGLQIIPLPFAWVQAISPQAAAIHALAGETPLHATLSLDAATTFRAMQKGIALVLIFLLTLLLIRDRKRMTQLFYALLFSGLFQAIYGVLMVKTGIEFAFFIEKAAHYNNVTGTYLNRDHAAAYFVMTLSVGIGLMLSMLKSNQSIRWRAISRNLIDTLLGPKARVRLMLVMICIALVMTHSRMGNSAFFASLFIAGTLYLLLCRNIPRSTSVFLISIIVIDVLIISAWFGLGKVVERLENTSMATESRDEVARDTLVMIGDFPLTGIGMGNYFSTYPGYKQPDVTPLLYHHAHNDYLQMIVELGMIGVMPLLLAVLLALAAALRVLRGQQSALKRGTAFASLMAITAILIHSSVDFNLQIPANAATFIILLALPFATANIRRKT